LLADDNHAARGPLLARLAESSTVSMFIPAPVRAKVHITVVNARGDKLFVAMPDNATVANLKGDIEHFWQFSSPRQRIVYGGQEWTDSQTLSSGGITEGAVVKLFVKGDAVLSGSSSSSTTSSNVLDPAIKPPFFLPSQDYGKVYAEELATPNTTSTSTTTTSSVASTNTLAMPNEATTPAAGVKKSARGGRGGARGGRGGGRGGAVAKPPASSSSSSATPPAAPSLTSTNSNTAAGAAASGSSSGTEAEEVFVVPSESSDETARRLKDLEAAAAVAKTRAADEQKRYNARVVALQELLALTLSKCVSESKSKEPTAGERQSITPPLALLVALTKQTIAWTLHATGSLDINEDKKATPDIEIRTSALATLQQHLAGVVNAAVPFVGQVLSMATASSSPIYGLGCIEIIRMGFVGALLPSLMLSATSLVSHGISSTLIKPLLDLETNLVTLTSQWQSLTVAATANGAPAPPVLLRALSAGPTATPLMSAGGGSTIEERDEVNDQSKGTATAGETGAVAADEGFDLFGDDPTPVSVINTNPPISGGEGDANISIPSTISSSGLTLNSDTNGIDRVWTQSTTPSVPLDDEPEDAAGDKKDSKSKKGKDSKGKGKGKATKKQSKSSKSSSKKSKKDDSKSKKDKKKGKDSDSKKESSDDKKAESKDGKSDDSKASASNERKGATTGWVSQFALITRHLALATLSDVSSRVGATPSSAAERATAITSLQTFLSSASSSNESTLTLVLHHIAQAFADRSIVAGLESASEADRTLVINEFAKLIEGVVNIVNNEDQTPQIRLLALAAW
jgi:hypothetical protein